jgi:hypothetical protein
MGGGAIVVAIGLIGWRAWQTLVRDLYDSLETTHFGIATFPSRERWIWETQALQRQAGKPISTDEELRVRYSHLLIEMRGDKQARGPVDLQS